MSYSKRRIALRYWLHGRGYTLALEAMDFAEGLHTGVRKDGVTPEFDHQVSIAHHLRTLPDLVDRQGTLATAFLHDVREDYGVDDALVRSRFGIAVADAVDAMTKEFRGVKRPEALVAARIAGCPIASVAKPGDRVHNQGSMSGVFTPAKQREYIAETRATILPMMKTACRRFPAQERAYENLKQVLISQIGLVEAGLAAA